MRHKKRNNHLSRKAPHRRAMLANMASSLIEHKSIVTTLAKAKALRQYVEPLATKAKTDTSHHRRTVYSYLGNKYAVTELFSTIGPNILNRPGGYTRILKLGQRPGDAAELALIEFVDFNEFGYTQAKDAGKKKRRRGKKKKTDETESSSVVDQAADVVETETAMNEAAPSKVTSEGDTTAMAEAEAAHEVPEAETDANAQVTDSDAEHNDEAPATEPSDAPTQEGAEPDEEPKNQG